MGRGIAGLVLALLLAPFLVLISSGTASAVDTLCMPKARRDGLHRRHHAHRADPVAGVDVTLTAPDG